MNKGYTFLEFSIALLICIAVVLVVVSSMYRLSKCVDRGKTYAYCIFENDDDGKQLNDGW